jgi:hypothetical protein
MYGLTFENSKSNEPIAITTEGEILYLAHQKNIKKKVPKRYVPEIDYEKYDNLFSKYKGKAKTTIKNEVHMLFTDPDAINYIESEASKNIYRKIRDIEKAFVPVTKVDIDDGQFMIYPDPSKFNVWEFLLIIGQCKSGKSTVALKYSELFQKIFPDRDIYLISTQNFDETLDKNKHIIRLPLESFARQAPEPDEFQDSLVIFDDWESLEYTDKKMYGIVKGLLAQLITKGRHTNTRMICIRHKFSNSGDKVGQLCMSEATHYVIYPKTCNKANMKLILGTYGVMDTKQIMDLYKVPSRWIAYVRRFPSFIISECSCWLIR